MQQSGRDAGFGLVEAVVSTFITAIGVLSVATLFMVGTNMQGAARNSSSAIMLVEAELERIRTLATTAPERADGGSLTANVANHFAIRGNTIIRWQIVDKPTLCAPVGGVPGGPAECAKDIFVIGITPNGQSIRPRYNSVLWR